MVGVILNLSLGFGLHVLFGHVERRPGPLPLWWPDAASFDFPALVVAVLAAAALLWMKLGIPKTLALAAAAGSAQVHRSKQNLCAAAHNRGETGDFPPFHRQLARSTTI